MSELKSIPLLPSYFPLKLKKCSIPADDFFSCFEENTVEISTNSGPEALIKCSTQLQLYKECMDQALKEKNPAKKFWFF